MADVNVTFSSLAGCRMMTVNLDDSITAQEAVAELIAASFITPNPYGYSLAIKGGNIIALAQSFRDAGVKDQHNIIRIVPIACCGH